MQTRAEAGDRSALWVGGLAAGASRSVDEAVVLYRRAAEARDPGALGHAAGLLGEADRVDEAAQLRQNVLEPGGRPPAPPPTTVTPARSCSNASYAVSNLSARLPRARMRSLASP